LGTTTKHFSNLYLGNGRSITWNEGGGNEFIFTHSSNTLTVAAGTLNFGGTAIGNISGNAATVTTNANLTGHVTSVGNAAVLGSFTKAQLDTAVSDGNVMFDGDSITNATGTAWRVFYSDSGGVITELALGASGTFLKSNGASSAPTFDTPAGSGDVSKVGTPVDNQVGVWTGSGTLEGDADLTFDTSTNTLTTVNVTGTLVKTGSGNSSAPGFAFTADASSGLYYTSGNLEMTVGGTPTFRYLSNGTNASLGNLAMGANSITMTGSLAATGSRVTKGWFTDLESTNMPTVGGTAMLTISSSDVLSNKTLTAPAINAGTLTGIFTMGESTSLDFDAALSADGTWNGFTRSGTAGTTLAFGDLCYLDPTDSRWELVDGNAAAGADGDARGVLGICILAAAGDGSATRMLLNGIVRADTAFPSFTVNNPVYVSETAGDVTGTQPTTTDAIIRIVGYGLTADELYFNPDKIWWTHV
jgi:hypothetical protein